MTADSAVRAAGSRPDLRVGDADRDAAADRLAAHAAAGRLSVEEFEHRLAQAYAAVYAHDLALVDHDLPDLAARPASPSPGTRRPALPAALPVVAVVLTVLASVLAGHPVVLPLILAVVLWRRKGAPALRRPLEGVPRD